VNNSSSPPIQSQESFWNHWNTESREDKPLDRESANRGDWADHVLSGLRLNKPRTIDIGCGTGWLSARLAKHGPVVATDLAGDVIDRARERYPEVNFVAGDFAALGFDPGAFDVAVCLETLSHVADQQAFIGSIHRLLAPNGRLILTTQNRTVMSRLRVPPPGEGQIRNWVTHGQLKRLLASKFEIVSLGTINAPGYQRLKRHHLFPADFVANLAKRLGLGKTLVVVARRS
jgi:2-polyprenyl-3-methyl-5-hydroxy-6-metoxy-1,4-benzoquinol methylase